MYKFNGFFLILILEIILSSNTTNSQTLFQKEYSDLNSCIGYSILSDNTGFIIAGTSDGTGQNGYDVLILKTDLNGNIIWSNTIGGSGKEIAKCIKKTSDNGYIVVGSTSSYVASGLDLSNVFVIKIDNTGNLNWSRSIGSLNLEKANDIIETYDHKYTIAGLSKSYSTGNEDVLILQIDSTGTLLWSKTVGSTGNDVGTGIVQTSDNGFLIVGSTTGFSLGGTAPYLIKIDEIGALQYTSTYGFSSTVNSQKRYFTKIIEGYQNDFLITGSDGLGSIGDAQSFILNLSQNNTVNWMKKYFLNSGEGEGSSIAKANDGGVIIGGTMGIDHLALIKTDASGTLQTTKFYPDLSSSFYGKGLDVTPTIDNGFALVGYLYSSGDSSLYLIKTDNNLSSGCQEQNGFLNSTENITVSITNQTSVVVSDTISVINNPGNAFNFNPLVNTFCLINSETENLSESEKIEVNQDDKSLIFSYKKSNGLLKQIKLFDAFGRVIKLINLNDQTATISLTNLGVYFYKIVSNKGNVIIGKIVFQE